MDMFISILGAILSFIGAYLAYCQYQKSKSAAEEATRVKTELIDHRKISELSQLQACFDRAKRAMEKYGPAVKTSSLAGIDQTEDAKSVQDLFAELVNCQEYFVGRVNAADKFVKEVTPLLTSFSDHTEGEGMKADGQKIYKELLSLSPKIRGELNKKKEDTVSTDSVA